MRQALATLDSYIFSSARQGEPGEAKGQKKNHRDSEECAGTIAKRSSHEYRGRSSIGQRRRPNSKHIPQRHRQSTQLPPPTRSTIGGGGRGCNKFVPVLGGNDTQIVPTGNIFDLPPGQMRYIRGKLADHVGDHVVLFPEGSVLVTSPGTKSSYPRPPQSLNTSPAQVFGCPRVRILP